MSFLKWYRFHPVTCAAMATAIVVLAFLNVRRDLFFGFGSTTILRFGHGWPAHYQSGPALGPRQLSDAPNDVAPTAFWGHPEFNSDPEIMACYEARLGDTPRTPWELRELAERDDFGILFDTLMAFAILFALALRCETAFHAAGRESNSFLSLGAFVALLSTIANAGWLSTPDAGRYILVGLAIVAAAVIATGILLAIGYRHDSYARRRRPRRRYVHDGAGGIVTEED